ncbi:Heavy metal RND efflux outer membrane protein [Collimonas arenae]|uniref:Heavy metal RND efflux outer membrane protein n=1 Tax=Collimonas arenae TaxID=279058 RepID=A0A0A1FBW2_9BURK|nr:TolC family protein [Collimonas arenae]AIY41230.1 Heavy metal RND efflux outer membrane protein [Collimonas arenae]
MNKFFLPLSLAVLACQPALAQDAVAAQPSINYTLPLLSAAELAGPLTLQQALSQAFKGNPDLAAAALEVKAVEASILQAGARPNPELATVLEDTRKATRTTTVQLNQRLELGGKRDSRIKAAEKGRDAAQSDYLAKRADIQAVVVGVYFAALEAQENQQLLQSSLQLAQRASDITAKRVAAGKVAPIEATKARVAEAGVRVELQQANSSLGIARRALAATWGDAEPAFSSVDGHINELPALPDLDVMLERLQNSPAFLKTRVEVERRQALVQLERSRRIPDVTVSIGGKRVEESRLNQMIFGLSIPIPVFDRNQGNLQEALQRADKARDELRGAQLRLDGELRDAFERLKLGRQQVEALQGEILPAAQNAYETATKGFELGKFSFLEVLDAQRVLFQAKSQALRAIAETHRAATEIERVVGSSPSTDSL